MRAGHCATPQARAEPFGREAAAQACIWLREAFDEVGRALKHPGALSQRVAACLDQQRR